MRALLFIPILLLAFACTTPPDPIYVGEIENWRTKRKENLKTENGFVNLAGLFWLKQGENTFGSSEESDLVFPTGFDPITGVFTLQDSIVTISLGDSTILTVDGLAVPDTIFYLDKAIDLSKNTYRFHAIRRGDRYGVRLKDLDHPNLKAEIPLEYFPIDEKWVIKAQFKPYDPPKTLMILNVIGITYPEKCPGVLEFEIGGKLYSVEPTMDGEGFFIIFGDQTNGSETYGSGKYLYANAPDENGQVVLDFNKSYNPPCAFTEFATCPLPPSQNKLAVSIKAGEKDFHW